MTISKRYLIACSIMLSLLAFSHRATAGNTIVSAKLDSAHVMMGNTVGMNIEIVQDRGVNGLLTTLIADTLTGGIEIAQKSKPDTAMLDNNRMQVTHHIMLQAFDPGKYLLPPVTYVVGNDSLHSSGDLTLVVDSIKVDTGGSIKDFKPLAKVPFKLLDMVPDFISNYWWAWLVALVLIAAFVYAYFKWFKKGINPLKVTKKRLPPYEEAMQALANLKSRNLWQNGQEKEYYTALTDILRVYIDRRFGINAVEMTSSQIMDKIKTNEEARIANDQLNNVLEIADFVKFANMRTLADDNEIAYQRALNFVEQTKPIVKLDEETGKEENDNV